MRNCVGCGRSDDINVSAEYLRNRFAAGIEYNDAHFSEICAYRLGQTRNCDVLHAAARSGNRCTDGRRVCFQPAHQIGTAFQR